MRDGLAAYTGRENRRLGEMGTALADWSARMELEATSRMLAFHERVMNMQIRSLMDKIDRFKKAMADATEQ